MLVVVETRLLWVGSLIGLFGQQGTRGVVVLGKYTSAVAG